MDREQIRLAAAVALGAALLVACLVVTPAAGAAITASTITTPANPSFFIADEDEATQTFAISGTTSGGNPARDRVGIRCYYGSTHVTVASNVALRSDGSFSVASADLNKILNTTCRLRAVPAGTNPSNLTPFAGPLVGVGSRQSVQVTGGPNDGKIYDYKITGQQDTAANDLASLGDGNLYNGFLLDPTYNETTQTFEGAPALYVGNATRTRSELQIDGANTYSPFWARNINPNASGFPALAYSYSLDAHTGNLVIHEADPLVRCPDAAYPPTTTSCPSFVSTGITDNVTVTEDHDGHILWVTNVFTSTDAKAHAIDLQWDSGQRFWGASGTSSNVEYELPGHNGFSTHLAGDVLALPSSPGTIYIRMHGATDGDTATGQGAIVYDRPATAADFYTISNFVNEFTLHQAGSVPAGGSTRFRFAFVQDYHAANVASLAQTASTAFLNTIGVSRSGSGNGTVASTPAGISCGKTCSHGYAYGTSVTLKAAPAKNSTFAGWSGACTGMSRCTVTTNDPAKVNAEFALRPCVVPNVEGKILKTAEHAIKLHFCSIGKIEHAASSHVEKGRVISQKPPPHRRLKPHGKVNLLVSTG
jgi:Divergent InlB B-repeat domain/PASTA domain